MRYLLVIPLVILFVGFHVVSAQAGAVAVLLALLLSGVLWRILRVVAGGVLILAGLA